MSVQLHNTKLPEYGETIYSDNAGETLQHIYDLADARQDFDNNKWLYTGNDFALEYIEMSSELAQEVVKALRKRKDVEKDVELAEQIEACIWQAKYKWGQEAVRLEVW